jgi:predicted transposase YbfD/YdcC
MSTPQPSNESSTQSSLNIILMLQEIEDPRISRARKHNLSDILFIALCTVICGGETFEDMELFGRAKEDWLRNYLELPNGIPSHDTFNRVFQLLAPKTFQECLIHWTQNVRAAINGEIVAIDGKAQRRARNKNQNLHYIVNAWAGENRLLLGQYKVDEKSNEITAIPELLRILELSGCIITCDAMGCQKKIAKEIIESDAHYVLALKGNHEIAEEEISTYLNDLVAQKQQKRDPKAAPPREEVERLQSHSESEKEHGRITTWHYHQSDRLEWFEDRAEWEGLQSVGMVETITEKNGVVSKEKRYYLCSIDLNVKTFARAVRGHWGVENRCHWVLDVIFKEDESRARSGHAAENLSTTRGFAMNLIRQESSAKKSLRSKVKKAGWNNSYLEKILVH